MTLEMLNRVDWVQVLTDAATAIAVILVAVGVGRWAFLKPLSARFLLIVRLAISAWGTLAAILGAGTTVAVAP
ncbi:Complete genome; segment 3/17 [Enterobacter hormaechei]|nr:Complete genome; segment 3/17 [Enterobacter hormaechei]